MTKSWETILQTYGVPVDIGSGAEQKSVRAFVQRIRRKEKDKPEEPTPFGASDLRRWLYLGPADCPMKAEDTVCFGAEHCTVQTAEKIFVGGMATHWWAILRPAGEVFPG